jgi:hypothetical protein
VLLVLVQVALARKIHRDAHFLALGWLASLGFFAVGTSAREVFDYQIALLFAILGLPLFIDAEAPDVVAGFMSSGLSVFVLVSASEGFDERFRLYFAT